jgi:sulfoxide reductase heme-binding subunit YedZ
MTERDPSRYVFWLASRSAGLVAFVLVATSVILGLYMAANLGRRPGYKRTLVKVHEQVALAAMIAIAAHGLLLLGDRWLNPGIVRILIPFTMPYRPVWTGIGVVAGYIAFALGLTFYARRRIGAARWRKTHRLIVVVYVLGAVHALGAGSDGAGIWLRGIVVASALPIAALLIARYRPGGRRARPRPARPLPTAETKVGAGAP